MTTQMQQVEGISDVVKVFNGGIEFYKQSIDEVENPKVRQIFQKMIAEKDQAVTELQPFAIAEQGEVENDTSWAVKMREVYTSAAAKVSDNTTHTYVKQLEEVEDKVLDVLDDALEQDQPSQLMAVLNRIRARAQNMHDEMKALQDSTE